MATAGLDLNNRWTWAMARGLLFAIAGIVRLAAPGFTPVAIAVLIGGPLMFSGIATAA